MARHPEASSHPAGQTGVVAQLPEPEQSTSQPQDEMHVTPAAQESIPSHSKRHAEVSQVPTEAQLRMPVHVTLHAPAERHC